MAAKMADIEHFRFRDIHNNVYVGTASDRYAGWIGQIYSGKLYEGRISSRTKRLGGKAFVEEVLPVESVEEYFRHFGVLELDFTFYGPLLDKDGKPTQNLHVLRSYSQYLGKSDRLILKVPQSVFSKKLRRGGAYIENEEYLNPDVFLERFYKPALGIVGPWLSGLIFEQEYQRKQDRSSIGAFAKELNAFFRAIPEDGRYHVEIRTDALLVDPFFDVLESHGVGQVLSHWTWLPTLSRQFALSGRRFFNRGKQCIIRLMTPHGMRYQDAYALAHPFSHLKDGMMNPEMMNETADLMRAAIDDDVRINIIINNRAGGNAPLIAKQIVSQFLAGRVGQ